MMYAMRRNYVHDKVLEKAKRLVRDNRIELLDNGNYNIIGDHGTYTVAQDHTGKLSCNCPGYLQKHQCSHITAVMLLTRKRRRKPR